jgi:hypothetical protein
VTSLEEKKWLVFLLQDLKHNRNQRGKKNYENGDYDDDDDDDYDDDDYDDDDNDFNVFFSSKGTSNRVGNRRSQ